MFSNKSSYKAYLSFPLRATLYEFVRAKRLVRQADPDAEGCLQRRVALGGALVGDAALRTSSRACGTAPAPASVDWVGRYVDGDGLGIELARGTQSPTSIVATSSEWRSVGSVDSEYITMVKLRGKMQSSGVIHWENGAEWHREPARGGGGGSAAPAAARSSAPAQSSRPTSAAAAGGGTSTHLTLSAPAGGGPVGAAAAGGGGGGGAAMAAVVGLLVLAAAVGFVGRSYARHGALRADLLVDDARLAAEEAKRRAPLATARARALFDAAALQGGRFARVGMAEAADADGASLGQRVVAALKAAAGGVRRAASPSAGDEEAAAPDPEEAERYKGLALDAEGRYQGLQ